MMRAWLATPGITSTSMINLAPPDPTMRLSDGDLRIGGQ
jgi:hypothetical protein